MSLAGDNFVALNVTVGELESCVASSFVAPDASTGL